jgi:hypothetical protein
MSESETHRCKAPSVHHLHICQLKKKGLKDEIVSRSNNPGFICHNCNATANSSDDLCNCSPFYKKT